MNILFMTRPDKPTVDDAMAYLGSTFDRVRVCKGQWKDALPVEALVAERDILISYLSPWVIPMSYLKRTRRWNLNFHPGPPEYPGIGCTNFAIFNGEREFGVTAHVMAPKVDSGEIILVRRFPVSSEDTVSSLTLRCYEHLFHCLKEVIEYIIRHDTLPRSEEKWQRQPYTRRELEALCRIDESMSEDEIEKRIRATTYPNMPGAYIEKHGKKFEFNPNR